MRESSSEPARPRWPRSLRQAALNDSTIVLRYPIAVPAVLEFLPSAITCTSADCPGQKPALEIRIDLNHQ